MRTILASELKVGDMVYDIEKTSEGYTQLKVIQIIEEKSKIMMKQIEGELTYDEYKDSNGLVAFRRDSTNTWFID